MSCAGTPLKYTIDIDGIYSVYYFDFSKIHQFESESRNFWTMVYVDNGSVMVAANKSEYLLNQGSISFFRPDEQYELKYISESIPNIAVISFSCTSKAMNYFENKHFPLNQNQRKIILRIITEYSNTFLNPLNIQNHGKLIHRKDCPIGSEQLLKHSISELLITLLQSSDPTQAQSFVPGLRSSSATVNMIVDYMQSNLNRSLQLNDIIKHIGLNKATITNIFKEEFNMGAIEYFIHLKIEYAKLLLRETSYNITQISELLGYSTIHYFSRQFKKTTGMSPTEYADSVMPVQQLS